MKNKQKISPKYWVGHDKRTDDVFLTTARKSYDDAYKAVEEEYGVGIMDEHEDIEVILVEIKKVKLS